MKKAFKIITFTTLVVLLSSFTKNDFKLPIGTYSVSDSDHSQIKLILNADYTFYYQDFSLPEKKIVIHGNWILKRKNVRLISKDSKVKFHSNWKFNKNGQVAKSQKGLSFYTLRKSS